MESSNLRSTGLKAPLVNRAAPEIQFLYLAWYEGLQTQDSQGFPEILESFTLIENSTRYYNTRHPSTSFIGN